MNKKQSMTIPTFVWVLIGIIVVSIIFLIAVHIPFTGKIDKYNKDHASATSLIEQYKDYLARAAEVQSNIDQMMKECSEMNEELTINASKTTDDFRVMLQNLDYDLSTLSVTKGRADSKGRVSATGDPLYVTTIRYAFTANETKLLDTLKYFESESNGAYFVSKLSVKEETTTNKNQTAESGQTQVSQQSISSAGRLYSATLEIQLYYFDMSKNKAALAASKISKAAASSSKASA